MAVGDNMTFARKVKIGSLVLCCLLMYTFFGGITLAVLRENNLNGRCHAEGEKAARPAAHCHGVSELYQVSMVWPLTLVVWGVGSAVIYVAELGSDAFTEATQ